MKKVSRVVLNGQLLQDGAEWTAPPGNSYSRAPSAGQSSSAQLSSAQLGSDLPYQIPGFIMNTFGPQRLLSVRLLPKIMHPTSRFIFLGA